MVKKLDDIFYAVGLVGILFASIGFWFSSYIPQMVYNCVLYPIYAVSFLGEAILFLFIKLSEEVEHCVNNI